MTTPPSGLPERETGASRELDAMIAERVMGWTWRHSCIAPMGDQRYRSNGVCWKWLVPTTPETDHLTGKEEAFIGNVPHYSSDIAAAMEIIPKLHEMGLDVVIGVLAGDPVSVDIWQQHTSRRKGRSEADTLPLAICRAALAALDAALLLQGAVEGPSNPHGIDP